MNFDIDPIILLSLLMPIISTALILSWKKPLIFLGIHVSSRAVLDGMSSHTYTEAFAGFSIMQVYSIVIVIFICVYLYFNMNSKVRYIPILLPVLALIFSFILSGIASNNWMPILENTLRWIYMLSLSGLIVHICITYNIASVIKSIWLGITPAIIIQAYPIVMNDYTYAAAGHISYRGGFYHHSMLSYFILAFIATSFYLGFREKKIIIKVFYCTCALYGHLALYLCGYRTSMIALIISWIFIFIFVIKKSQVQQRTLVLVTGPMIVILFIYFLGEDLSEKLHDLWKFARDPFYYIDFGGGSYVDIFSGRLYITNFLMHIYLNAPLESIIAGMGVDSSKQYIGTYAHNEYLSALFETGIMGLIFFITFIVYFIVYLYKSTVDMKIEEIPIFGMAIALLIMTLATMPFRDVRAILFFALILGIMHYKAIKRYNSE